jgi:hypothetical protein
MCHPIPASIAGIDSPLLHVSAASNALPEIRFHSY